MRTLPMLVAALALVACAPSSSQGQASAPSTERAAAPPSGRAVAIFAGGCFWCMEGPFEALDGVDSVTSGYTGGRIEGPSYRQVSSGTTRHAEAVHIVYDPERVTYARLLEVFWHNVDPTQSDGQFCDHGPQYRTGIFVANAEERRLAEASKVQAARTLGRRIVTEITDAGAFWVAEGYHQDFYRTNPARYRSYRAGCGRDRVLRSLWGDAAAH
ncbi:MAG: peptide-methionine (S)-S-oxide reductase MsrA [Sandaracinaceae bacterium]